MARSSRLVMLIKYLYTLLYDQKNIYTIWDRKRLLYCVGSLPLQGYNKVHRWVDHLYLCPQAVFCFKSLYKANKIKDITLASLVSKQTQMI